MSSLFLATHFLELLHSTTTFGFCFGAPVVGGVTCRAALALRGVLVELLHFLVLAVACKDSPATVAFRLPSVEAADVRQLGHGFLIFCCCNDGGAGMEVG